MLFLSVFSSLSILPMNWIHSNPENGLFLRLSTRSWSMKSPTDDLLMMFAAFNIVVFLVMVAFTYDLEQTIDRSQIETTIHAIDNPQLASYPPLPEDFTLLLYGLQPQILASSAVEGIFESLTPNSRRSVVKSELILDYHHLQLAAKAYNDAIEHVESVKLRLKDELTLARSLEEPLLKRDFNHMRSGINVETPPKPPLKIPAHVELSVDPLSSLIESFQNPLKDTENHYIKWLKLTETHTMNNGGSIDDETDNNNDNIDYIPAIYRPATYEPSRDFHISKQIEYEAAQNKYDEARNKYLSIAQRPPSKNSGVAFLTFSSTTHARQALAFQHRHFYYAWGWRLRPAPAPGDILWKNIHLPNHIRMFRKYLAIISLVILSFLLTSSALLTDYILPGLFHVTSSFESHVTFLNPFAISLIGFVTPFVFVLINSYILPGAIYFFAGNSGHWLWSRLQSQVLNQNTILLFCNTIILPIFGGLSIYSILLNNTSEKDNISFSSSLGTATNNVEYGLTKSPTETISHIATIALNQTSSFSVRYLLTATFLSSSSQLLQLPKLGIAGLMLHIGQKNPVWRFDFGYWYAYALSVVMICFIHGIAVPILFPIALFQFAIK